MPRKPIQIERTGLRTPRERMWAAMMAKRRFVRADIEDAAHPAGRGALASYIQGLLKAGYLGKIETGRFSACTYHVLRPQAAAPVLDREGAALKPALGTLAMWRAMKVRKTFDADQIAADATQGGVTCTRSTARSYVNSLARAGYLRVEARAKPGTLARMRLVKDTGPNAPAITRAKVVFDRNTGELVLAQTAQEVGDGLEA